MLSRHSHLAGKENDMTVPVIQSRNHPSPHGGGIHGAGGIRGDNSAPEPPHFDGRFGRIFRFLPAAHWEKKALLKLGKAMISDAERDKKNRDLPAASLETSKRIQDDEENAGIPAGYTYLGQFIDHDITFDPASSLQQWNDPYALLDYRTPCLDLDSLYGRGPDDQPYMYDGKKFRLGRPLFENTTSPKVHDLPRYIDLHHPKAANRALIGDKRNDENVIVAQLHAAMMQFHNKLVDRHPKASFRDIQKQVRWHYQWIVVNDFLIKICGKKVVHDVLPHLGKNCPIWEDPPRLVFFKYREFPFMPVEFSVAAYRFGHSMVRPVYRLNTKLDGGLDPQKETADEERRGINGRFFIFAGVHGRGLNGFDQIDQKLAIDWSLFFDINGSIKNGGIKRVQPAYKIDTSLVNPLGFLPEFSERALKSGDLTITALQSAPVDPINDPANLAQRNLLRGLSMGLPSGQDVARAMGVEPIKEENLKVGRAVVKDFPNNPTLESFSPSFKDNAPLWFYVLAEAQYEWFLRAKKGGKGDEEPVHLGRVGGRIVAETLIGLLWSDGSSYLRQAPNWKPDPDLHIRSMGDLISFALK